VGWEILSDGGGSMGMHSCIIVWDGPVAVKCGANLATLHGLEYAAGEGTQEREECVRGSMRSGKGMQHKG